MAKKQTYLAAIEDWDATGDLSPHTLSQLRDSSGGKEALPAPPSAAKSCGTCAHEDTPDRDPPCSLCGREYGESFDRWQPKPSPRPAGESAPPDDMGEDLGTWSPGLCDGNVLFSLHGQDAYCRHVCLAGGDGHWVVWANPRSLDRVKEGNAADLRSAQLAAVAVLRAEIAKTAPSIDTRDRVVRENAELAGDDLLARAERVRRQCARVAGEKVDGLLFDAAAVLGELLTRCGK
jgi:hypothetical protein